MDAILAIDIGNTHTHWALFQELQVNREGSFKTACIAEESAALLGSLSTTGTFSIRACSVVPEASKQLKEALQPLGLQPAFLTAEVAAPLRINYPKPAEIGPDRLANALGAISCCQAPVIVIDMGTAVTFDIISAKNGYEGGVIAPGFALLSDYLAEKTALLPRIDLDQTKIAQTGIGKSTRSAMEIGCVTGFSGMIREILEQTTHDLRAIDGTEPTVLITGGTFRWFRETWLGKLRHEPRLTLEGLCRAVGL